MKRGVALNRLAVCRLLLLLLIVLTLCFIWSNSMQDATASGEQSGYFRQLFCQLFDVTREPFRFLYENLRKVAHFLEFALLGAEVAALVFSFRPHRAFYAVGYGACVLAAAVDEGIQLFSPGRVAALLDVGIDAAGALCGTLFLCALLLAARLFKKK